MVKYDVVIIGAGPSGIFLARKLFQLGKKIAIFEKSNNIGGRLATRRFKNHTFNIGVNSFESTVKELNEMVQAGIENETLIRDGVRISAKDSITSWTKALVENIEVHKKSKLQKIEFGDNENILHFEGHDCVATKDLILTTPAPQAKEVFDSSGLDSNALNKATYKSSIIYMIELDRKLEQLKEFHVIQHVEKDKLHFYLLEFEENWNEKSKEELREEFDESFKPIESYVHKWKYAKVDKSISSDHQFDFKSKSVYLAGDYFFGSDMDASILSAQNILDNVYYPQ